MTNVVSATNLSLVCQTYDGPVHALSDVNLEVAKGDFGCLASRSLERTGSLNMACKPGADSVVLASSLAHTFETNDGPVCAPSEVVFNVFNGDFIDPSRCGDTNSLSFIADLVKATAVSFTKAQTFPVSAQPEEEWC